MNILAALTVYPPAIGGAQLHTHQIMRQLAAHHHVQVASFWSRRRTDWLLGTTLLAPLRPEAYSFEGIAVQQLTLGLRQRFVALPWVLGYYGVKYAAIAQLAAQLAPQLLRMMPAADIVHCARIGREPLAFAALGVARQRGVPFVLAPYHHPRWKGWNYRALHALYRAADGVLALTSVERDELVALGVRPERIFIVGAAPNLPPSADGMRFRAGHSIPPDAPFVLFLGQKYRYKGWSLLLDAAPRVWQHHPNAHFVFVGPRSGASKRAFVRVRDPHIIELDTVSEQEKADALASCTAFCLPSSQESFGMVYAEAWSYGRPVVALDIPALRAVIDDGVDGFRVPPGDATALAARLVALLSD
ncbi:MAG: glycosyltransferase family 4 protein, partial [Chloroflexales bacterium]|nr:glycosyltransferase family 4 protein [Chloroflexales bacterium]